LAILCNGRWAPSCPTTPSARSPTRSLAEIFNAEDKDHALKAAKAFEDLYGAKWPRATAKITKHLDVLLAF